MADSNQSWHRIVSDLYQKEEGPMFNIVYRWVWNEQEAIDIVHEAFLAFWKRKENVEANRVKPYLYRTALNLAANKLRARKLRSFVGLDFLPLASNSNPDADLERRETSEMVRNGIDRLGANQKKILLLAHFSQISYEQIAETLGIPMGTVASRISRAQAKLKTILESR